MAYKNKYSGGGYKFIKTCQENSEDEDQEQMQHDRDAGFWPEESDDYDPDWPEGEDE